jgi:hypothetical protein
MRSLILAVAAAGLVAVGAGTAAADTGPSTAALNSPGLLSGNAIQVPINVPVNACGNSLGLAGLLSPATGNACANNDTAVTPVTPVTP